MTLWQSLVDPASPPHRRLLRWALLCLLLAACGYRVWLVVQFNPMDHIWSDPGRHWNNGIRPLDTSPMSAIDAILYQIYVGALAKITVQQSLLVAYWTALLSLSGPWLWYRFLRELFPQRDWALTGWVVLAGLPSWSAIYSYFMQETLMLPLLGLALWATWRCRRKGGTASFVVAVAAWLAAGLTRGICLPLGAVAMTWLWFAQGASFRGPPPRLRWCWRSWAAGGAQLDAGANDLAAWHRPDGAALPPLGRAGIEIEFTRRGGRERGSTASPPRPRTSGRWRRCPTGIRAASGRRNSRSTLTRVGATGRPPGPHYRPWMPNGWRG